MGYDNFALLSVDVDESNDQADEIIDLIINEMKKIGIGNNQDEILFGKVHRIGGIYNDWWYKLFDDYIYELYTRTKVKTFYVYLSEFDGDTLTKYTYTDGVKSGEKIIKSTTDDPDVNQDWNIHSLHVKNNITIFYNEDYDWDFNW